MDIITSFLNHTYNLFYLAGFAFKNILWLRILMIIGAAIETIYFILPNNIDWYNVSFGIGFILINSIQIIVLKRSGSKVKLSDEESHIYNLAFTPLHKKNFKKLISEAKWETAQTGTVLVMEGMRLDKLMLIFNGVAEVRTDGQIVAYLRDGNFIGEMSFITGNKTSAKVTALADMKYLTWDKEVLTTIASASKEIEEELSSVFKMDLMKKLVNN
jgi:hypothetical protein